MKRCLVFAAVMVLGTGAVFSQNELHNLFLNGVLFQDVTEQSGFIHQGHGKCTAMADFDMDGKLDIYISVVYGRNKLFHNEGKLRFRDVTESYGVACPFDTHGIAIADFNNDGYLDMFVANNLEALSEKRGEVLQPNFFYIGGDEGFVEYAVPSRLDGGPFNYSCGVTTADVNGDGLLDIYVAKGGYRSGPTCANSLFINNGDGAYRDIAKQAGVADEGNGYCCSFCDYDNDGLPDLYVGNLNDKDDQGARRLYHNEGNLKFTDVTKKLGMQANGYNVTCLWLDVDNDGFQDLFLANSSGTGASADAKFGANTLFHNNGNGTFTDISKQAGVDIVTNSRGATFGDIDNDGDLDIYVTNSRYESLVLLNDGKGKFTEAHEKTGGSVYYGHGCAFGDLDNDGDLDLTVGNWRRPGSSNPGEWKLFENKTNNRNYIKLNLEGAKSNRSAVMSKASLYDAGKAGDRSALRGYREVWAGSGTFPGNPLQVHFGADSSRKYDIVVTFPSGQETVLRNIDPGQTLKVVEGK
ncbi:MAG: CRTAC1 family protein [Candidatus Latescibacter sp.]|nr:CRTAC1 family protein [Candidatus Latescibacter sp.]